MTLLRLADDDPEGARRELDAVMARWSHRGFHVQHGNAFRADVHIDLYRGDGLSAWRRFGSHWAAYRRSQLLRVQILRIELLELRGRTALAAAPAVRRPGRLLGSAARDAAPARPRSGAVGPRPCGAPPRRHRRAAQRPSPRRRGLHRRRRSVRGRRDAPPRRRRPPTPRCRSSTGRWGA